MNMSVKIHKSRLRFIKNTTTCLFTYSDVTKPSLHHHHSYDFSTAVFSMLYLHSCVFYYVSDVSKVSVLVPGAGLGRLAWEVARLGYTCQGNEWSLFMLFSSNFVLNR